VGGDMEDLCWNLFKSTGQINYYLLYSALKKDREKQTKEK